MPGQSGGSLRPQELDTLLAAVTQRRRVIMVSGAGGVGKTTLVREAISALAVEDPGRPILLVEVDAKEQDRLQAEIRDALGQTLDASAGATAGESPVVVLDAAERMLRTADDFERVLALTNGAVVVVTTRYAVALPGAVNISVRGLGTHAGGAGVGLLRNSPHLDPDVSARTSDYELSRIARALHGNPLALNVAAALFASLTPQDLLQRLSESGPGFLLDETVPRPGPETRLRDVITWGVDTLPHDALLGLCVLAEFAGWTSTASFEGVLRDAGVRAAMSAPSILSRLVRAHLVESSDVGGMRRVRLLDTVRDTVRELGRRFDIDLAEVRAAHARWYTALALRVGAETAYRTDALRRVGAESANYAGALRASLGSDPATSARAAAALGPWLLTAEYSWTGLQIVEEMLASGVAGAPAALEPSETALLRSWRSRLRIHLGGREEVGPLREIARAVGVLDGHAGGRTADEELTRTVVAEHLAYAELRAGDAQAAIGHCAAAEAWAQAAGLGFRRAQLKYQLARAYQQARRDDEALREAIGAERLAQSLGDESLAARCALTRVQLTPGLTAASALPVIRPLARVHLEAGDHREACHAFLALGSAESGAGDQDAALVAYRQALQLARRLRYWHGQLYAAMGVSLAAATDENVHSCLHLADSVLARIAHVRALLPPAYVDQYIAGCDALRDWSHRRGAPPIPPPLEWPGIVERAVRLSGPRASPVSAAPDHLVHQAARQHDLSERERSILVLLGRGLSDAEISARLGIAPKTLRNINSAMYKKLGVRTRSQAVALAHERR